VESRRQNIQLAQGRGAKPTIGDMLNVLYRLKSEINLKQVVKEMKQEWEPRIL
jgi:hypothetical protein